ncbi:hypothetical protein [Actinacidiphila oryziradicis]|uniref:Uncharacterized protein n=1 Tax=Actinacidiphila oryziradicis TaxID=2571141 RepID=A0A4U0RIQ3_9ACTN|nr:hypothetical protein [Actinacidiphila oryziradicis]TJZ95066.1 hypothetical protein FCI23_52615 [Actinacidiphila oryziradicis]
MSEAVVPEPKAATRRRTSATQSTQRKKIAAGVGGASTGTLMLSLAHIVGTQTAWGVVLTWAAPSAGAMTGVVIALAKSQWELALMRWNERQDRKADERAFQRDLKIVEKYAEDPTLSDENRAALKREVQEAKKLWADRHMDRIRKSLGGT